MTRPGRAGRVLLLESAHMSDATDRALREVTDPRERVAFWINVCALWCCTPAERDQFVALVKNDHTTDALAMLDVVQPRLHAHFSDLTPPTDRAARRQWERTWKERAREWAPPTSQEAA